MFVPIVSLPTQLTRIETEAGFVAEDPWNGNRPCTFTLDSYMPTLRGAKSVPKRAQESPWSGGFHRALRSEADGIERFLPESLIDLWLQREVSTEALPALLKQIEPSLRKSDYKPILRSRTMKVFVGFEVFCCTGLVIIAEIAVGMGHAPWWLAISVVAGTAGICWLFLYLVYFRMLFRRQRQMRWLRERIDRRTPAVAAPSDRSTKEMVAAVAPSSQPDSFDDIFLPAGENLQRPAGPLPPLPPPLLPFDASHIPPPPRLISPPPMPLQTVVHPTKLDGKEIQLNKFAKNLLPTSSETAEPRELKEFKFESVMAVPDVMEPAIEPRLQKAFPEFEWEDRAENSNEVRIEATSREMPQSVVISIVRNQSTGTFKLWTTVCARDQAEAVRAVREMVERLKLALLGWSQFHLPQFKTRPFAGIDIDREEIVDLVFPLERGQIKLSQATGIIVVVSRILLEALSVHGEILDNRAKQPENYPDSDNAEGRAARARGAAARLILRKALPTGAGKDLDVDLSLVSEAHSLIGELLENALAQVVLPGPGGGAQGVPSISPKRIKVHYFCRRTGPNDGFGYISYRAADDGSLGEFLRLDWWSDAPFTTTEEQIQTGFASAFKSSLDRNAIAAHIDAQQEFQTTSQTRKEEKLLWSGKGPHGSDVEIRSKPDEGLFGLSIVSRAEDYFEIRNTIHNLLDARLVVTSILDEISATLLAKRDILELDGQNVTELPPQIGTLTELQVLSLSKNKLTFLPDEIGLLSKLVELAVDENCLAELPASIGDLANLQTLNLAHNQLRRLPTEIGKLSRLRRLNIQDNRLRELPAEFIELDELQDFDWKKWESTPRKGLPPRNIRNFMAEGNPWVYPPAEIMKKQVNVIRDYLKAHPIDPGQTASGLDNPLLNGNGMNQERWASPPSPEIDSRAVSRPIAPASPLPPPLPCIISSRAIPPETGSSNNFRFQSMIDVPEAIEPTMERRLRKDFPELKWQDHAENWDKVRIEGISQKPPQYIDIWIARRESPGPFRLTVTIGAQDQSEAEKVHNEIIRRLSWAFIGWSPFPLPKFNGRSAAKAEPDQEKDWEDIVSLQAPLEGPRITIFQPNADVLISRTLVEAFSLHLEVLDRWIKAVGIENSIGDDPENREAVLRGQAARVILRQSVSTDTSNDLQAPLVLLRPSHKHLRKNAQRAGDSSAPPQEHASPIAEWRRAAEPCALLSDLLELGLAEVVLYGSGGRVPGASTLPTRIKINYRGSFISYSAADGEAGNPSEFLRLER